MNKYKQTILLSGCVFGVASLVFVQGIIEANIVLIIIGLILYLLCCYMIIDNEKQKAKNVLEDGDDDWG